MPTSNDSKGIKITLDDLANVEVNSAVPVTIADKPGTAQKSYGTLTGEQEPLFNEERGSLLLQGWFYLGAGGLLGALAGWAISEHGFVDGPNAHRWGNVWILPLVMTFFCISCGVAESIVERSPIKALKRALLALPLGIALGFVFMFAANVIYAIGTQICYEAGVRSFKNPAVWIARGVAWIAFGVGGGVVYGIVGQSSKKLLYGIAGGMIGAGLGGILFDPVAWLTHGGAASRALGFGLFGLSTGIAMGFVESALKDRWLYVTAGPLAGKQFILYKALTVIGSQQQSDIYLFKDSNILPQHAVIEVAGARVQVRALGDVYVGGQSVKLQVLQSGTILQIGRYAFRYQEKQKK